MTKLEELLSFSTGNSLGLSALKEVEAYIID